MTRRSEQAVMAVVRLVGPQETEVTVQHPGTDDAVVAVRIGKALLYLHQEQTAEHFVYIWDESKEASKSLPDRADWRLVRTIRGMPEPGIVVNAIGRPASSIVAGATRTDTRQPFLRVQLGRLAFEIRDRRAHHSCVSAFRDAYRLARTTFLEPGSHQVVRGAMDVAADAFFPAADKADLRSTPARLRSAPKPPAAAPRPAAATRLSATRPQPGPTR